jgi:hypothetical protein
MSSAGNVAEGNNTMSEAISDWADFMTRSFQIWRGDIIANQPLLVYGFTAAKVLSAPLTASGISPGLRPECRWIS